VPVQMARLGHLGARAYSHHHQRVACCQSKMENANGVEEAGER
jgi:hypothetical protein